MFTQNKAKKIVYVAQGFQTGLTDLTLAIRLPDATLLTPAVTFTEQGAGVYTATFTPTQVGNHQFGITSVTNGDNFLKAEDCVAFDTTDNEAATSAVATAVADVKSDVDASVTAIQTAVSGVKSDVDASTTALTTAIAAVQTTVNNIKNSENKSGGYVA